jgi:hypothetical protein
MYPFPPEQRGLSFSQCLTLFFKKMGRRKFVNRSIAAAGLLVAPSFVGGQSKTRTAPSGRLNIAIIGVDGKGRGPTIALLDENVVALWDVDQNRIEKGKADQRLGREFSEALATHEKKGAKWFVDYREMFVELDGKIDAVVISTPDHMHFPIAMSAINRGIHVYCEKPLTHTVEEARLLAAAAAEKGIAS